MQKSARHKILSGERLESGIVHIQPRPAVRLVASHAASMFGFVLGGRPLKLSMRGVNPRKNLEEEGDSNHLNESNYYEGESLTHLLGLIERGIHSSKLSNLNSLPEKIWLKKQIAIGINEVTRLLERKNSDTRQQQNPIHLQVVIVVADCKPKMLTKHIPNLAASRNVPVLYIRDNKRASLRLGELVRLKTALAIGVKARGTELNLLLQQILLSRDPS